SALCNLRTSRYRLHRYLYCSFSCRFRHLHHVSSFFFFFFIDTAPTEIYTLSLHDALPIWGSIAMVAPWLRLLSLALSVVGVLQRSEEHTSELQSHLNLVCRLLLEKKKKK